MTPVTKVISKYKYAITKMEDVNSFLSELHKFGIMDTFHPDTDFSNYLDPKGNDLFTHEEVASLNTILSKCISVCKKAKANIYEMALTQFPSKRSSEIKKAFDKEIKKCYTLSESLEEHFDTKLKYQSQDYLNWKHVDDAKKVQQLLSEAIKLLKRH